jgi:hypothetical protein
MIGMKAISRGLPFGTRQSVPPVQHGCSGQDVPRVLRHQAVRASPTVLRTGTVDLHKLPFPELVPYGTCDIPIQPHVVTVVPPHNTWPLHRDDRQPYYMRSHIKALLRRQKDIAGETIVIAVPGEVGRCDGSIRGARVQIESPADCLSGILYYELH